MFRGSRFLERSPQLPPGYPPRLSCQAGAANNPPRSSPKDLVMGCRALLPPDEGLSPRLALGGQKAVDVDELLGGNAGL